VSNMRKANQMDDEELRCPDVESHAGSETKPLTGKREESWL